MPFSAVWDDLLEACRSRKDEVTLLTPSSRRRFTVEAVSDDRIDVAFPDEADERSLLREQFEVLAERIEAAPVGLDLSDLPTRVEPYATVLSLADRYVVDEERGVLRAAEEAATAASGAVLANPLVVEGRPEPTPPERVHGDLLLLADLLERLDVDDPRRLSTEQLADLYVLLSEVQRGADQFRRAASDELLARVGPEGRLHGRFGTVHRTSREIRHPKPDEEVFAVLDRVGVPREWVTGVDPDKLDVVLAVTEVEAGDVYDVSEQVYMQKTGVEPDEKRARLQGVRDRLAAVDSDEAEALMDEVEAIEGRLDDLLAAG
ncbi:MAG TPA: hypothetical protein VKA37_10195 [Halobacteriales archaeon]|nr:hypothetical protein [Halobacteriales archaeon]